MGVLSLQPFLLHYIMARHSAETGQAGNTGFRRQLQLQHVLCVSKQARLASESR